MRANIFIICLLAVVLAFAFCAGPSLAKSGIVDLVRGQVTDPRGAPLPGADVFLEDGSRNLIASAVSDSGGNFSFANVSAGGTGRIGIIVSYTANGSTYNSTGQSPAWYPANRSVIEINPADSRVSKPTTINTSASVIPFTALGQVTDARGNPVAGADVVLYDGIYQVIATTKTNQDGNFGFTNVVANSPGCKVKVNYTAADGKRYETHTNDVLWYPTDVGLVKFDQRDTQLTEYPGPAIVGFVWGTIVDAAGNPLSGTVYLTNGTANLSIPTYESQSGPGFIAEVPAGNYTAYAEAKSGLKSKPESLDVRLAVRYLDTNSVTFVADQATSAATATPTAAPSASQPAPAPFASPVMLLLALVAAVFVAGAADVLQRRR